MNEAANAILIGAAFWTGLAVLSVGYTVALWLVTEAVWRRMSMEGRHRFVRWVYHTYRSRKEINP